MISRLKIKKMLIEAAELNNMHMTMQGEIVPFGCPDCIDDLDCRISDMAFSRDSSNRGTASRVHYNGVLGDLRMKKRSALKQSVVDDFLSQDVEIPVENDDNDELLRTVVATMLDDEI